MYDDDIRTLENEMETRTSTILALDCYCCCCFYFFGDSIEKFIYFTCTSKYTYIYTTRVLYAMMFYIKFHLFVVVVVVVLVLICSVFEQCTNETIEMNEMLRKKKQKNERTK